MAKIVSKYDQQLVRDGESSCSEKMWFFWETFKFQSIRPPYMTLHVTSTITVRVSAMFVCKVVPLTI